MTRVVILECRWCGMYVLSAESEGGDLEHEICPYCGGPELEVADVEADRSDGEEGTQEDEAGDAAEADEPEEVDL